MQIYYEAFIFILFSFAFFFLLYPFISIGWRLVDAFCMRPFFLSVFSFSFTLFFCRHGDNKLGQIVQIENLYAIEELDHRVHTYHPLILRLGG